MEYKVGSGKGLEAQTPWGWKGATLVQNLRPIAKELLMATTAALQSKPHPRIAILIEDIVAAVRTDDGLASSLKLLVGSPRSNRFLDKGSERFIHIQVR